MWDEDGSADPETPTLKPLDRRQDRGPERRRRRHARRHRRGRAATSRCSASDATIEPARAMDTTRPLFTVRFDGATGEELSGDHFGRAWHAIAVMAAAESVGVAARVTGMAVDYAKERKQFGRAIGSYQAVSHACAQMFLETEGARSVTYWAAWALDHDARAGVHGRQLRQGLRLRRGGQRHPLRAPGPRRHRLHLGARPAPVPQARRGQRARVRRRALAPRAGRAALL